MKVKNEGNNVRKFNESYWSRWLNHDQNVATLTTVNEKGKVYAAKLEFHWYRSAFTLHHGISCKLTVTIETMFVCFLT